DILGMMKGKIPFRWSTEGKLAFDEIKREVACTPILVCLDFKKDFIMYSYASSHTVSAILMQENGEGIEAPIAFMSCPLKEHELK
ncbi:hypothetical protein KI387_036511, partial [Taxus chinensis]